MVALRPCIPGQVRLIVFGWENARLSGLWEVYWWMYRDWNQHHFWQLVPRKPDSKSFSSVSPTDPEGAHINEACQQVQKLHLNNFNLSPHQCTYGSLCSKPDWVLEIQPFLFHSLPPPETCWELLGPGAEETGSRGFSNVIWMIYFIKTQDRSPLSRCQENSSQGPWREVASPCLLLSQSLSLPWACLVLPPTYYYFLLSTFFLLFFYPPPRWCLCPSFKINHLKWNQLLQEPFPNSSHYFYHPFFVTLFSHNSYIFFLVW